MLTNFFKKSELDKNIIFIVDDNEAYAKLLQSFLKIRFPNITEVKKFRIGELCLLQLHQNPSIIIMDYFLNSKYNNAQNGLEIIKRIKAENPSTGIIVLSIQDKFSVVIEAIKQYDCKYIEKGDEAFKQVEQAIKDIFNNISPSSSEKLN